MRLEHYTEELFMLDRDRTYVQHKARSFEKPVGLWVSVAGEDDWPTWCREQEFCLSSLNHVAEVKLAADANVLLVEGAEQLLAFHQKYAGDDPDFPRLPHHRRTGGQFQTEYSPIKWEEVAANHQGIIIAPYVWSLRLTLMWWYGWDCQSGCIWDLDAIDTVTSA